MPLHEGGTAPYTSVAAAVAAIGAFRERAMSTPITADTLVRVGVPESIAGRTLNSLKALELLDDNGELTAQLTDLRQARGDDEFRARLQEWLRGVYAEVLGYTDPSTDPPERVAEAFRTYEPAGQRRAMAALLIGLWRFAGLPVAEGVNGPPRPQPRSARRPTRQPSATNGRPRQTPPKGGASSLDELPAGLVGLLRQIPRDGASWTTARRDDFVRAFGAVLDFSVPVDDDPVLADEEEEAR